MKKKLIPALTVICIFLATGVFAESGNAGVPAKTVAISNTPIGQTNAGTAQPGSIYNQIMSSQERMNKRMDKFFNDPFFSNPQHASQSLAGMGMGTGYPKTQFFTEDDAYILQIAVPGIDKENIVIELNGNILTVSAKNSSEAESKDDKNNYQSYRNISNAFTQSFTIPPDVDTAKITSNYKNGLLRVDLPKDPAKSAQKKVKITVD